MDYFNKPKEQHVYALKREGSFNWLNSKDVQIQYRFQFPHLTNEELKELDIKSIYLLDPEKEFHIDGYSAIEVAYELQSTINEYWINTDKEKIDKLVEYLESIEEEQEKLRGEYDIEYAKAQIDYWTKKLSNAEKRMDE